MAPLLGAASVLGASVATGASAGTVGSAAGVAAALQATTTKASNNSPRLAMILRCIFNPLHLLYLFVSIRHNFLSHKKTHGSRIDLQSNSRALRHTSQWQNYGQPKAPEITATLVRPSTVLRNT